MDGDSNEEARREDDAERQNVEEDETLEARRMIEEDETLEARRMERSRSPSEPTQAEIRERWEYGHTPFRSWCRQHESGQDLTENHMKSKEKKEGEVPVVSLYFGDMGETVNTRGRRITIASVVLRMQPNQSSHGRGLAEEGGEGMDGQPCGRFHPWADQEHATKEFIN